MCKPHYLVIPGIVDADVVNKYLVRRTGVLENDVGGDSQGHRVRTASGFNLDYTEHRDRSQHAKRVAAAVTEPCPPMAMSAYSS